jgi:hypothetical protein
MQRCALRSTFSTNGKFDVATVVKIVIYYLFFIRHNFVARVFRAQRAQRGMLQSKQVRQNGL